MKPPVIPSTTLQQKFWNDWNAQHREQIVGSISLRQSDIIQTWLRELKRVDLDILDVGCGSGWMCERMLEFGRVSGTDQAGEVIARAQERIPAVRFVAADFMTHEFLRESADVVVSLEVLSHVPDQPAFVSKIAEILKSGGYLMMATQNRFVLQRLDSVAPMAPGLIRNWVDAPTLRRLLQPSFEIIRLISIAPNVGHRGILRLLNSPKLNAIISRVISRSRLDALKERCLLGHTLMAYARKR